MASLASTSVQVGYIKDQSVYRLAASAGYLAYDPVTRKCSPLAVDLTVSRNDGTDSVEEMPFASLAAEGLAVWVRVNGSDGSGKVAGFVKATSLTVTLPADCSAVEGIEAELRRDGVAIDSIGIPVKRDGEAAVMYDLFCSSSVVHFNADGSLATGAVSVIPRMIQGRAVSPLPVNSQTGAEHWCLFAKVGSGKGRMQATSLTTAQVRTLSYGRFDLVPKSKAVCTAVSTTEGVYDLWEYDTADVVASKELVFTRDGTNGTNGSFTSIAFIRASSRPATPTGGTYDHPVPSSAGVDVNGKAIGAWSDAPMSGSNPLWLSRARFSPENTTDANAPAWSQPELTESSSDVVIVWCKSLSYTSPPNTPAFPYVSSGAGDPWGDDSTGAYWMAVAVKNSGVWGEWRITKVKGEGAVSVIVTPNRVTGDENGNIRENTYIKLQLFFGADEVKGFSFQNLCPDSQTGGTDPVVGIHWRFETSTLTGGAGYLIYKNTDSYPSRILEDRIVTSSVTYNGVQYPFTVEFAKSLSGITGKRGAYQPTVRMWSDYPHESAADWYHFEAGTDNEERIDCVLHGFSPEGTQGFAKGGFNLYKCVKGHDWSADKEPGTPGGQDYWEYVSVMPLWACNVLLASKAYIELLSSNGIRIVTSDGRVVGQFSSIDGCPESDGIQVPFFVGGEMDPQTGAFTLPPLFAVATNGMAFFGGTSGKRIEIDPGSKAICIYDAEGNLCATHSGRWIDLLEPTALGQSGQSITVLSNAANMSKTVTTSQGTLQGDAFLHSSTGTSQTAAYTPAPGSGTLKVEIPSFTVAAKMGTYTSQSPGGVAPVMVSRASLAIEVWAGTSKALLKKRASVAVGNTISSESGQTDTLTTEAKVLECPITEGEVYEVRASYVLAPSGTNGSASYAAKGNLKSTLVIPQRVAHYGCNGWYIASGNQNFEYHLFDSAGKLHVLCKSGNVKVYGNDS